MRFPDRATAGRLLAVELAHLKDRQPVVLALPRGGVAVGFEIARALDAPLDIVLVRKIGVPWQPELALGAVTDGASPGIFIDQDLASNFGHPGRLCPRGDGTSARRSRATSEDLLRRPPVSGNHRAHGDRRR